MLQYGILTSHRAKLTAAENSTRFETLRARLRNLGFDAFEIQGRWRNTPEPAFFVPSIGKDTIVKLGREFEQDAVLYSGPETEGQAMLLFRDGASRPLNGPCESLRAHVHALRAICT